MPEENESNIPQQALPFFVGNGKNGLGSNVLVSIYKKDEISGLTEESFLLPLAIFDKETLFRAFEHNFITGFRVERREPEKKELV